MILAAREDTDELLVMWRQKMIARPSVVALALGAGASLAPVLTVVRPDLDPELIYRLRPIRRGLALGAVGLAAAVALARPSAGRLALVPATALLGAAAFLYPERVFVPLDAPPHVPAREVDLGDEALVLGFASGEAAVAWPIETLIPHHLVNDRVGDRPVLASYCPLCRSGVAFDPRVEGRDLAFEVAGLARGNMLMRDLQTGSIWQQATGEAVAGPLRGARLEPLLAEQTTWAGWRADYPATALAVPPPDADKGLIRFLPFDKMTAHFAGGEFILPGKAGRDERLPSRADVAGIVVGGEARAYPIAAFERETVINDRLGGCQIALVYDRRADRVRAFDRRQGDGGELALADGHLVDRAGGGRWTLRGEPARGEGERLRPLPVERQWWMSWREFHPGTTIYS
jgi:hypothetical protein